MLMSSTALPTVATVMYCEDLFARCQGEKVVYHQRSAGLLLPPSLFMRLIMVEGDGVRKIASKGSPKGQQIYGERAIKSLYKDTRAEFSEYSVYKACMAQVNDAGGIR